MTDIYIYLCFSVKKTPRPKSHPGKDPDYLQIEDRILGEGENKGNIRQRYIITVLLAALLTHLKILEVFLTFMIWHFRRDQKKNISEAVSI